MAYYYQQESLLYYTGKTSRDDLTDEETTDINRATWVFCLNPFAQLCAAALGLAFVGRPSQLFI
jgi:hypothetical protein